jgi:hypothetical protein
VRDLLYLSFNIGAERRSTKSVLIHAKTTLRHHPNRRHRRH